MGEARQVLELMGSPNAQAELDDIHDRCTRNKRQKRAIFERLHGKLRYGKPIFLAIAIGAFNQLSGINAILYYLNDIFNAAGFSQVSSNLQAVGVGAMNFFATFLGMALIDRLGRKKLLLIGAVGTQFAFHA